MLSLCIPYHSGIRLLEECLRSIELYPPDSEYEIIVVEDASPEPCGAAVSRQFPDVRVLRNDANVGFARSANRAVAECRGDQILILNPDTRVLSQAIPTLRAYLAAHPDVAAVGPMTLNRDGTFQPQCKRGRLTPLSALGYGLRLDRMVRCGSPIADYLRPGEPIDQSADVEALSGSCMLVARRALEDIGGFDESLFLYGEDLDLCYRFRDAGWKIRYLPEARIVHAGGEGGTSARYFRSLYHYHRSTYVVLKRNAPARAFPLYGWAFALGFAARFGVHAVRGLLGHRRIGTAKTEGAPVPSVSPADGRSR